MKQSGIEIEGGFRNTQNASNVDWYYGGGDAYYASLAAACSAVPSAKRSGQTVGVINSSTGAIEDFWWPNPSALADGDLTKKGASTETQSTIKSKLGAASGSADGYLTSSDFTNFTNKVGLTSGKVPVELLPSVYFSNVTGTGTLNDPYVVASTSGGQVSADSYLRSLAGYSDVEDKVLYISSGTFNWGSVPTGSLEQLGTPTLTIAATYFDGFNFTWNSVTNASAYSLQRDTTNAFATPVLIYAGANRSFTDNALGANTNYYYRLKATGAGFAASNYFNASGHTLTSGNITPNTPTAAVTDDAQDTFNWTNVSGYTLIASYEYTLNGGTSYTTCSIKPISIGNANLAAGQVGVRIKADTGRNASGTLFNTVAYTTAAVKAPTPTAGVVDNDVNTFNWTFSSGFTSVTQYEYTLTGSGGTYITCTEKPISVGDVAKTAGQVGVRVKAASGVLVSDTLYNTVAFTATDGTAPLTQWRTLPTGVSIENTNTLVWDSSISDPQSVPISQQKIPAGASFEIYTDGDLSTATTHGIIGVATDIYQSGVNAFVASMNVQRQSSTSGRVAGNFLGSSVYGNWYTVTGTLRGRIVGNGTTIVVQRSLDSGVTWTNIDSATHVQPNEDLYVKGYFEQDNGSRIRNVRFVGMVNSSI